MNIWHWLRKHTQVRPYDLKSVFRRTPCLIHLGKILDSWDLLDSATFNWGFNCACQIPALWFNYSSIRHSGIILASCASTMPFDLKDAHKLNSQAYIFLQIAQVAQLYYNTMDSTKHQPKIGTDTPVAHPRHHCTRSSPHYQPGESVTSEHIAPNHDVTAGDEVHTTDNMAPTQTTVPAASTACFPKLLASWT